MGYESSSRSLNDDRYYLDFNEYRGEWHQNLNQILHCCQSILSEYPNKDSLNLKTEMAFKLQIPTSSLQFANGADDALLHYLLFQKRDFPQISLGLNEKPTYDHLYEFVSTLSIPFASFSNATHIYLCTPNNPTGTETSPNKLKELVEKFSDKKWIVDLTYVFYSHHSINEYLKLTRLYSNVTFFASMAKTFPIAGCRFAITVTQNKAVNNYFSCEYNYKTINNISRYLMKEFVTHWNFYANERRQIWNNRSQIGLIIKKYLLNHGIKIQIKTLLAKGGNFVLLFSDSCSLENAQKLLGEKGIQVRHKAHWDFIRVTSVNDKTLAKIKEILDTPANHFIFRELHD